MSKKILIIILLISNFIFTQCRKECRILGDYLNYDCPKSYESLIEYKILPKSWFPYINDNCAVKFKNIGYTNEGCALIINDSITFLKHLQSNEFSYERIKSINPVDSIDFDNETILGFDFETDYGSGIEYQEFLCVSHEKKEYIFRFQYELEDQCAGSQIDYISVRFYILINKITEDYNIEFSVENVNPFPN